MGYRRLESLNFFFENHWLLWVYAFALHYPSCRIVLLSVLTPSLQPSVITVGSNNMMYKWCVEHSVKGGAPQLVLDRSYKFQGGL